MTLVTKLMGTAAIFSGVLFGLAAFGRSAASAERKIAVPTSPAKYRSPTALVADAKGKNLYVAQSTANSIAVLDLQTMKLVRELALPLSPTGLALSADSSQLIVTAGNADGVVLIVDASTGVTRSTIPIGHTPMSPVLSPDGKTLYVCNRFNNSVSVIDLSDKSEVVRIAVLREPVAAALTPDGQTLLVANHLPVGPSNGDFIAAAVSIIDTGRRKVANSILLPNGSSSLRGICISPDGKYAYVTHVLGHYQLPTTQLERGWMNTNALSIIDITAGKALNTVLLDDVNLGAANPWAVACTPDGKYLCVTHAGSSEISVIDRVGLHQKFTALASGKKVTAVAATPADVVDDLSFLAGLRQRIALPGNGPRGLTIVGSQAIASEYFTDTLAAVDIAPASHPVVQSIPLGAVVPMSAARKGEMYFNDAALCFQKWQSCASCHPDARGDGLNWDLLNDGIGNPKNTKSMLLSIQTPPAMGLGIRETSEAAVRSGIRYIQFAIRPDEDAQAIVEYLKGLAPVPSPYLVKGQLSPAAKRGAGLFNQAGCVSCHPAPLYTNLRQYNLGTGTGIDAGKPMDTPTLVELWRTAPFLHDGRAATIKEVLTTFNSKNRHGNTTSLSPRDLDDLADFVLSQ